MDKQHGGKREGAGRKPRLSPSERLVTAPARLTPAQVEQAKALGDGNVSAGIRKALELAAG